MAITGKRYDKNFKLGAVQEPVLQRILALVLILSNAGSRVYSRPRAFLPGQRPLETG